MRLLASRIGVCSQLNWTRIENQKRRIVLDARLRAYSHASGSRIFFWEQPIAFVPAMLAAVDAYRRLMNLNGRAVNQRNECWIRHVRPRSALHSNSSFLISIRVR